METRRGQRPTTFGVATFAFVVSVAGTALIGCDRTETAPEETEPAATPETSL